MMGKRETFSLILDGWGRWELDPSVNEIRFYGDNGHYQKFYNHPLLCLGIFVEHWENVEKGVMLVFDRYGSQIYKLYGKNGDIKEGPVLNRKEGTDYGLMHSQFEEHDEKLLLIYESGIIGFDKEANVIWEKNYHKYDWQFTKIADGLIWFRSDYRGEWAYDLNNGEIKNTIPNVRLF